MKTYIIRRLLLIVPTLFGITVIVFLISRIAPGGPTNLSLGSSGQVDANWTADVADARRMLYGLNKPIHVQFADWLGHVLRLDFGYSVKHHRPVIELIKERLPVTLILNLMAFIIIYFVSLPAGVLMAVKHGRLFDRVCSLILMMLWSLPVMWVGQMLIGYFTGPAFKDWFPSAGLSSSYANQLPFFAWLVDSLWHLALPVLCLSYGGFAYLANQVRSGMLDNLRMDYVRTARAKGLPERVVILRHVFRNSIIPLITITSTLLPAMFAGSVIVERIFSIPGMGLLAFEAVSNRDYNVIMAVATIAGFLNSVGLLLADIAYAIADPRISFEVAV